MSGKETAPNAIFHFLLASLFFASTRNVPAGVNPHLTLKSVCYIHGDVTSRAQPSRPLRAPFCQISTQDQIDSVLIEKRGNFASKEVFSSGSVILNEASVRGIDFATQNCYNPSYRSAASLQEDQYHTKRLPVLHHNLSILRPSAAKIGVHWLRGGFEAQPSSPTPITDKTPPIKAADTVESATASPRANLRHRGMCQICKDAIARCGAVAPPSLSGPSACASMR